MKNILQYFLRGMLVVLPLTATFYLIYGILKWINNIFNNFFYSWFDYEIPGLGIITGFAVISFIGFLVSRAFAKPIVHIFEKLIIRTPLVNIVYSSLIDLTEALVG
ncbi:MAG: DUF502 domain-containing protein, partial [Balneolaceae bacterium]